MRSSAIDQLVDIAARSLTVEYLATTELHRLAPTMSSAEAAGDLRSRNFDFAIVHEDPLASYVAATDLHGAVGTVLDHARPITTRELVSKDLGVADGIMRLEEREVLFVFGRTGLFGMVTRADVQRPAASMIVLALLLAAEAALHELILQLAAANWHEGLNANQRGKVEDLFEERRRGNAEISRLECLTFEQRLEVVRCNEQLRAALGFDSKSEVDRYKKVLRDVRNELAHGGDLLDAARGDPRGAVTRVRNVREFADRVRRALHFANG